MTGECRSLVLGTAGHIDHGKSALVKALTGVDPDRLPEEKARGITLDLGFAALDLGAGLQLGVVDVPGHERLVRTMVAGATGIDLVLLVVAADEGLMPQTREHAAICRLLDLRHGVVALTKMDLVSRDVVALASEEVRELLAGTPLAGSPLVPVAAPSGEGLAELRDALRTVASAAAARARRAGPPRLAVDRAFSMRGFGTVVTGTLAGGPLAVGDAVEIVPAGLRARVRGLQRHGAAAERVEPGSRCAVNLQGVEVSELARGDVVTTPDALAPTGLLDVELTWLAEAPPLAKPAAVELLAGTAERRARIAPIGVARIAPGGRGFARVHVEGDPLPLLPGDRFVVRGFSRTGTGGHTVGGGAVLDVAPPHRRRSDPALFRDLEALAGREPETELAVRVARAGLAGVSRAALAHETGLSDLDAVLTRLIEKRRLARTEADELVSEDALAELARRAESALAAFHEHEPLRPGMSRAALRGALPGNVSAAIAELAVSRLVAAGRAVVVDDAVRRATHRPAFAERERALLERLCVEAHSAGLEPPTLREWAEALGVEAERLRPLLAHLAREGTLVATRGELWFDRAAVDALRERVVGHLREHRALETPAYKSLIGTTRKHAVPLMELFDAERITLRVGNKRVLRGAR